MDDIVQARKARMKMWNTSSEKVCEVQTVDESGASSPRRYTNRRYSDFVGSTLAPIPSNRRASENFVSPAVAATVACVAASNEASNGAAASTSTGGGSSIAANFLKKSGIVVTKNDLMSLMSSLTSSANEIHRIDDEDEPVPEPLQGFITKPGATTSSAQTAGGTSSGNQLLPEPGMQRSNRSNSFDVSILHNAKQMIAGGAAGSGAAATAAEKNAAALSGWFEKRHQPMSRKKSIRPTCATTVSFSKDVLDRFKDKEERTTKETKKKSKLRWDNKGSFVDPHVIGNAIEGFLRKSSGRVRGSKESRAKKESAAAAAASGGNGASGSGGGAGGSATRSSFWFGKGDEDDSKDTCESSLCSTLKDLFVK